jgi:dTMP kinase
VGFGVFVTFEGVDGSGKSTQARLLEDRLRADGRDVLLTREPGGTELGERVRELLLGGSDEIAPWAEAALFAAARAELVERVIRPALERGSVVVCDRYLDSSLAYQGIARGLGVEEVLELNLRATGGLLPDRTFLLDGDPDALDARLGAERDRLEREGDDFRLTVARAYRELAARFPERIVVLDASAPPEALADEVAQALARRPTIARS